MSFDNTNPAHLAALKTEVLTDPNGYGYNPDADPTILEPINLKREEITVQKPKISASLVRSRTTREAYDGLLADNQEWLRWMTGSNGFEEENMEVTDDLRQALAGDPIVDSSIWAVGERTAMNASMLALMDVNGSRAEELFGYGTVITAADWHAARDS